MEGSSHPFDLIGVASAYVASFEVVPKSFSPFIDPNRSLEAFTAADHRTPLDFELGNYTKILAIA
jgi:hypothetical protein